MKTLLVILASMLVLASSVNGQIFGSVGLGGHHGGVSVGVQIGVPVYTYPVYAYPVITAPAYTYPVVIPVAAPIVYSYPIYCRPAPYFQRGPYYHNGGHMYGRYGYGPRGQPPYRGGRR